MKQPSDDAIMAAIEWAGARDVRPMRHPRPASVVRGLVGLELKGDHVRRLIGWLLTIAGLLCAVYGVIQFVIGAVPAIRGGARAAPIAVALGGVLFIGVGALAAWGGGRLRRSATRRGRGRQR
jgi:hypothetical protein